MIGRVAPSAVVVFVMPSAVLQTLAVAPADARGEHPILTSSGTETEIKQGRRRLEGYQVCGGGRRVLRKRLGRD